MKKNIGIWIDTKQAFIIKLLNNKHSIKKIDSNIETRERILGESKKYGRFGNQYLTYEKNTENKRKNQTTIFFKILLKEIVNYNSIVLFGPSNMKNLFEKEIKKNKQFTYKIISVSTTKLLTENQMVAWVKNFYKN